MMEEEFDMRGEPPQAVKPFGSPSKLRARILRKKTTTQAPEPRKSSSFLKGTWETVWGCDVDDVEYVETPFENIDSPLDSVPDQDNGPEEVVTTPTNDAPCGKDKEAEITPIISSDLPSTSDPNAWMREDEVGHQDVKSLQTSTSRSAKRHSP